ncbi:glycosyltransferase family 2 protein [Kaistella carnis]|uniref:glycosyltransferase family 2 protein n=1 Tax=Kaistella carnis TaxID=1241979 RepID=UPI0028970FBF|nr:glycosyltransferase family A protein [Kaistella carnis]
MFITIAIPFYNAEEFLADAIRSVFAQTHQDWELLLIDDGSTDGSLKIVQSITDPRVKVFSDGQNKRLATRLNEVTHLAKYDYIARMDADDLMSPDRLATQIKLLEENPEIDLISTGMYSILNNETLVGYRGDSAEKVSFEELLRKQRGILHASILARKSWYLRNFYNESLPLAQDSDMWLRASKKNDLKIKIIPEPLYIYREEQNITAKKMLKAYKIERNVFSTYIDSNFFKFRYICKSHIKSFVISGLDKIGYFSFLLKRRNKTDSLDQYVTDYNKILKTIKSVKL